MRITEKLQNAEDDLQRFYREFKKENTKNYSILLRRRTEIISDYKKLVYKMEVINIRDIAFIMIDFIKKVTNENYRYLEVITEERAMNDKTSNKLYTMYHSVLVKDLDYEEHINILEVDKENILEIYSSLGSLTTVYYTGLIKAIRNNSEYSFLIDFIRDLIRYKKDNNITSMSYDELFNYYKVYLEENYKQIYNDFRSNKKRVRTRNY